jgi:hypothetical protein
LGAKGATGLLYVATFMEPESNAWTDESDKTKIKRLAEGLAPAFTSNLTRIGVFH